MIRGMTGHGRGEARADGLRVRADVRTVNHRFLDCEVRGPVPPALEAELRRRVDAAISRGRVEVQVALESQGGEVSALRVNVDAMHAMVAALREVARDVGVADELRLEHLASLPWARVVEPAAPELDAAQSAAVGEAVEQALRGVVAMRVSEGEQIAADMRSRLDAVEAHLGAVRGAAEGAASAHAERLRARIAELLGGAGIDPDRIAQEAAILADRADICEEIQRLGAFLVQLRQTLDGEGASGKRLDFILQEAFREVNTIGSKSRSLPVSSRVIEMKAELERMREQVANVE